MTTALRATIMVVASVGCVLTGIPLSPSAGASAEALPGYPAVSAVAHTDGRHDFDFNVGRWKAELRERSHALTGSQEWSRSVGTMNVRPLLDGMGNLVEISASGAAGPIAIVGLRLYDAKAREWSLAFATKGGGAASAPLRGHFAHGRGVFYGQETIDGRMVLVRFTFFAGTAHYNDEEAYSADGGKTWEVNFLGNFTKLSSSA